MEIKTKKIIDSLKINPKDVGSSEVQIGLLSDKYFDYAEKIEKLIQKNK